MVEIEIKGFESLNDAIKRLRRGVKDLRPLFEQFSQDFYKQEKKVFNLKSRGKYKNLSKEYRKIKKKKYGFIYPILFAEGRLAASLLDRGNAEAVNYINETSFIIGTSVPYAVYHHSDKPRNKMPYRPLWILDGNNAMFRRWVRQLNIYFDKMAKGAFK
jgi:phage gpG-like protein